jgi:glycosyltransferase involved in cell wall biosynthesis
VKIGLLAIMQNEIEYVERWMSVIDRARAVDRPFDRVLIVDGGSEDRTVEKLNERGVEVVVRPFDKDFSAQRNYGIEQLDVDWIFELDADEYPSMPLIAGLRDIANDLEKHKIECCGMARLNLLDGVLQTGVGSSGLDYQYRFHRRECRWEGTVHEEIRGWNNRVELSLLEGHFLVHDKARGRHDARNAFYRIMKGI